YPVALRLFLDGLRQAYSGVGLNPSLIRAEAKEAAQDGHKAICGYASEPAASAMRPFGQRAPSTARASRRLAGICRSQAKRPRRECATPQRANDRLGLRPNAQS